MLGMAGRDRRLWHGDQGDKRRGTSERTRGERWGRRRKRPGFEGWRKQKEADRRREMESKMDDINKRLPGRRTSAALSTLDANNFRTFEDSGRYGSAVLIFWPSVLCLDVLCCYMGHVLNCKAPTVPVSRGERPESASHILPRNRSIRLSLYSPPSSYLHPANYHTGIAHHV